MARRPRVHCELGPVILNRTAVYKMCKTIPPALAQRGLDVRCSALLARVGVGDAEPVTRLDRYLFDQSRRWLLLALSRPGVFLKAQPITRFGPRVRHGVLASRLFMDALFFLFYGPPREQDVVLIYDITPVSDPGWHQPNVGRLYRRAFAELAQSGCQIVTSCQNTADQLRANWGIAPSRLTVLPLGLFSFPEPRPRHPQQVAAPFLLFVGATQELRKNVVGLIRAYAASGLYGSRGIRLRIIGSHDGEDHPVVAQARQTPGVDLLGHAPDDVLADSYAHCLAFAYPSFCEGFGFPLLEAMQRGCACLSTITGASPEMAQDAAWFVNPYSISEIADCLRRIVDLSPAERDQLGNRAREQARRFTWDRFHDGLVEVLKRAA